MWNFWRMVRPGWRMGRSESEPIMTPTEGEGDGGFVVVVVFVFPESV